MMMGEVTNIPELISLGRRHGKSAVQVAPRWLIQRGVVVIPKSVSTAGIQSNADLFDFELSEEEMVRISHLEKGRRLGPDPDTFNFW